MITIVLGDIHLEDKYDGYLQYQIDSIISFLENKNPSTIVFLGDIFHKRKPTPTEILGFHRIVKTCGRVCQETHILRGNHDTETKAEKSPTILSVYTEPFEIYIHIRPNRLGNWGFIPHYEDDNIIRKYLKEFKECDFVFAHCGFRGCFNSIGDHDFNLSLDDFYTTTILGHIHQYREELDKKVIALGTPYPTSFREANKDSFYGVIDDGELSIEVADFGPMYLKATKYNYASVIENYSHRYILLQLMVDKYEIDFDVLNSIKEEYTNVGHLELKFEPVFDEDNQSSFSAKGELFRINESIIDHFLVEANTTIPIEELKSYLKGLSDEYTES